MSPINEWGRTRPELLDVFKRLVTLFEAVDPPSLTKLSETAVALDILDRSSEIGGFDDPIRTACYRADIDYECFDLASGKIRKPLLLYSGHRWMDADSQHRLLEYVETGGHLVFFDQLPVLDALLRPCNLLGLREPESILSGANLSISLSDQSCDVSVAHCFRYDSVPGEPIYATRRMDSGYHAEEQHILFALPVGTRTLTGYQERRGEGLITVFGIPPSPPLLLALHRWMNVPLYSRAHIGDVSTALYQRDGVFYLIAANNQQDAIDTQVTLLRTLFDSDLLMVDDLWMGETYRADLSINAVVSVRLAGKSGTVLRLQTIKSPQ